MCNYICITCTKNDVTQKGPYVLWAVIVEMNMNHATPTRRVVEKYIIFIVIFQVLLKLWYGNYLKNTRETLPEFSQEITKKKLSQEKDNMLISQ